MRIVVCLQILKNIIIQRERMFIMVKYLVTAAEKRENAIMEKRIVAVQKEVQESEAFSTIYQSLIYCLYA